MELCDIYAGEIKYKKQFHNNNGSRISQMFRS